MKKCPYCAEEIQDEAIYCRYCQHDLNVIASVAKADLTAGEQPAPEIGKSDNQTQDGKQPIKYGGVSRGEYALAFAVILGFLILFVKLSKDAGEESFAGIAIVVYIILRFALLIFRLKNMGFRDWWALLAFIPIVNIVLALYCFAGQEGYKDAKKLDHTGKIIIGIILAVFGLLMLAGIISAILANGRESSLSDYDTFMRLLHGKAASNEQKSETEYDACINAATDLYYTKSQGKMPMDQIKTASVIACSPCLQDKNSCKAIMDALKRDVPDSSNILDKLVNKPPVKRNKRRR